MCGGLIGHEGWGTALKPAWEPIILARKPLSGTVAGNVERYGTGALNIDGCRIEGIKGVPASPKVVPPSAHTVSLPGGKMTDGGFDPNLGRWPANVVLDEKAAALFPASSITGNRRIKNRVQQGAVNTPFTRGQNAPEYTDAGSAARFFYCAKASRRERDLGCADLPSRTAGEATDCQDDTAGLQSPRAGAGRTGGARNIHPTVKPLALMRWLVRLVTPPGGLVLDPFAGSGSTGVACVREGLGCVLIERDADYVPILEARLRHAQTTADCED